MNSKSVLRERYRSQASRKGESYTKQHRFHLFETEDIFDKVSLRLQSMKLVKQWAVVRIVLDNSANLIVFIETTAIRCKFALTKEFQYGRRIQFNNANLSTFMLHYFFSNCNFIDKEFIDDHEIGYYQIMKEIDNVEQLSQFKNIRQKILQSLETEYDELNNQLKKLSIQNENYIDEPEFIESQFDKLEIADLPNNESQVGRKQIDQMEVYDQPEISDSLIREEAYKTIDIQADTYEENVIEILNDFKLFFMDTSKDETKKQDIYNQLMEIDQQFEIQRQEQSQYSDSISNMLIMIQTHIMQLKDTAQYNQFIKYYEDIFNEALLITQSESS